MGASIKIKLQKYAIQNKIKINDLLSLFKVIYHPKKINSNLFIDKGLFDLLNKEINNPIKVNRNKKLLQIKTNNDIQASNFHWRVLKNIRTMNIDEETAIIRCKSYYFKKYDLVEINGNITIKNKK